MKEIQTEIEIAASAERVWHTLTDFAAYPEWNPFIVRIEGEARAGTRILARLQPPGTRGWTFRPMILKAERPRELRWLGRLGFRGIFDSEHTFIIEPLNASRVRFINRERFTGLLVPFLGHKLDERVLRGFTEMNDWLKKRAEEKMTEALASGEAMT